MRKVVRINEVQYRQMFLGEERHYPSFLDRMKKDVSLLVYKRINRELGMGNTKFTFPLAYSCEYTDVINFDVCIDTDGDVSDRRQYACHYYNGNNSLVDGKVLNPTIYVHIPSNGDTVMYPLLSVALSHELTHLYDDWVALSNGHEGVNFNDKNTDTTTFVNASYGIIRDELYKSVSMMAYMSLDTEGKAFLSQTVQELSNIGCTLSNYREKLKETSLYSNITKSRDTAVDAISNCDADALRGLNDYVSTVFPNANMPTCKGGAFDAETYRKRILRWVESVHHELMKRYGSVLSYYLDNLRESRDRKYGASFYV